MGRWEEDVSKTGKGNKKIQAHTKQDMKNNEKLKWRIDRLKAINPTIVELKDEQPVFDGCPKIATWDQ